VGPCQPEDGSAAAFDHRRTGLDHVAFKIADEGELDRWIAHPDELDAAHSPVRVRVLDLGRFVSSVVSSTNTETPTTLAPRRPASARRLMSIST
jgi:hypothetical protein